MKLIGGVGVNDADYQVAPVIEGKQQMCPFYRTWVSMLRRVYYPKYQVRRPTYVGCSVTTEWYSFMTFRIWMEAQPWEGNELDKDLLVMGNKSYELDRCVFVSHQLNTFTNDSGARRGEWSLGSHWNKNYQKFQAQCRNPFTSKQENLGYFDSDHHAHEAWRVRKHEFALQLANLQSDRRIADALRTRYAPTSAFKQTGVKQESEAK